MQISLFVLPVLSKRAASLRRREVAIRQAGWHGSCVVHR